MDIRLAIDTEDRQLAFDLFGNSRVGAGSHTTIPGGAELKMKALHIRKAFGIPETLELILTVSAEIELALVASWLYDKVKSRKVSLRIEETEVELEQGAIKRVLTRTIERHGE